MLVCRMSDSGYLEAVVAWALACLRGKEGATRGRADKKAAGRPIEELAKRFALDALERRAVELLYAAERSIETARELRARGGFTVEVLRDVLGDARVDALCAPGGKLQRRALVRVDDGWLGGARSALSLAPGLAARLDGAAPSVEHLGPGARRIPAAGDGWGEKFPSTARLVELVKDQPAHGLLTVEGCGRREAWALAVAAARWHSRAALVIDGEALASLERGAAWALAAAARRDADLDGDLLMVVQAAALGEAWRAAACEGEGAFVILADAARPREIVPEEGLAHRAVVLPALNASTGTVVAAPAAKKEDDGFDHIRAQAIRDAEKALGIVRREPVKAAIAPPAQQPPPVQSPRPVEAAREPVKVAVKEPVGEPVKEAVKEPVKEAAKEPVKENLKEAVKETVTPAAAAPSVGEPAAEAAGKAKRRSKKGLLHFGDPSATPPQPAAQSAAAAPPITTPAVAAPPAPAETVPDSASLPYVDVPADAPPDLLARIASSCPNPNQRIEVIYKLGGFRSSAVIAALRANTRSEHAGVRAAAEQVMASLFGPDWNRSRPVPKPVQRPPSDDKDRGPPGGW
ncbi:MAG TPA: hypothetical protein VFF06_09990 [Polyangia bacterium]|nr:hypothetical protein [Polyangia bacterium]